MQLGAVERALTLSPSSTCSISWTLSGACLGIFAIVQNISIPISAFSFALPASRSRADPSHRPSPTSTSFSSFALSLLLALAHTFALAVVQPHCYGALCAVIFCQMLFYDKGFRWFSAVGTFLLYAVACSGFEVGMVYASRVRPLSLLLACSLATLTRASPAVRRAPPPQRRLDDALGHLERHLPLRRLRAAVLRDIQGARGLCALVPLPRNGPSPLTVEPDAVELSSLTLSRPCRTRSAPSSPS